MIRTTLTLAAGLFLCSSLTAQALSGAYPIPGNYKDPAAAAAALTANGVSGPVTFMIAPGTYTGSFTLGHVQGSSATNTITFRGLVPNQVAKLMGSSGPTITFSTGTAAQPTAWFIFENLEFTGGPDTAITADKYCNDIEIRNCVFKAAHGTAQTGYQQRLIYVNGNNYAERWKFHHNKVTLINNCTYGIYLSQIKDWQIHHNDIQLNNARRGFYFINLNNAQNKFYNNLIWGKCSGSTSEGAVHMAASNYHNLVAHNTFLVETSSSNAFYTMGTTGRENQVFGNIFKVVGGGTCIKAYPSASIGKFIADGNLYWAPSGNVGNTNNTNYATLAAWQAATGQDGKSVSGDPAFFQDKTVPYDLRIRPNSPAKDSAVIFPGHGSGTGLFPPYPIPEDYAGLLRDEKPDMGAHEFTTVVSYGRSCPGTGGKSPILGYIGPAAIGSTTFAATLSDGLAGAGALLIVGSSNLNWGSLTLPFEIGGGCDLNARITLNVSAQVTTTGTASVPLAIPNNPALGGAAFHLQWMVLDPQAPNFYGLVTTKGATIKL